MLAALLAQAAATPVPPPAPADDIVVIGERLKRWTGRVSTTFGITSCRTTVSTGDREIDDVGCQALKGCWSQGRAAYHAALTAKDAAEAKRVEGGMGACLKERRDALVAGLADRRRAARARS